jgi:G3E family GTPase
LEHILSREATRKKFGAKIEDFLYTFFPSKQAELYENQIRTADLVVLNKTDLLDADSLNAVRDWLQGIHSNARRFETTFGRIPLELAIGVGRFDPAQIKSEPRVVHVYEADVESDHDHHHEHDHSLVFETFSFTSSQPFDLKKLRQALITLPPSIYRAKGMVYLADYPDKRDVLHVAGRRIRLTVGDAWGEKESKRSQIVMIGSHGGVDAAELQTRFTSALAVDSTPQTESKPLASLLEWLRTGISSS